MMRNELDKLIAAAIKSGNSTELKVLRAIKTAFINWNTSAENAGKDMGDADELKILLKMKTQREDSISQYKAGNRYDLAEAETSELTELLKYIPEQPDETEIESYANFVCDEVISDNGSISMKDMRLVMGRVQERFPGASVGKTVSCVVKSRSTNN